MLTLGVISLLAVILGTVGQYGVLSYIVAERTREIGVRMALGAEAGRVQRMVVGQGARVLLVGVAIGLAVAAASTRALRGLLFGVGALDPVTFLRSRVRWCSWACSRRTCRRETRVAGGSDRVAEGRVDGITGEGATFLR